MLKPLHDGIVRWGLSLLSVQVSEVESKLKQSASREADARYTILRNATSP